MTTKTILFNGNVTEELTFEEVYERFFNMIQNESWKMKRAYGKALDKDEIVQQFTIELWNAFELYDYARGFCFSTYLFNRFKKARRDLLQKNFLSKKVQFEKGNIASLDNKLSEESDVSFLNREFEEDSSYGEYKKYQPDIILDEMEFFDEVFKVLETDEKKDLVLVLLDKKSFSVNDYAEKWNISRQAANKRLLVVKKTLKEALDDKN